MGLKVAEGFLDAVAITDAAGALQTGLAPACTVYRLDTGAPTVLNVAEIGATGLYKVTDWTPAAATEYMTVWTVAGANTINYPFKLFKVGAGQEEDIHADVATAILDIGTAITDIGGVRTVVDNIHLDVGTAITNIGTVDTKVAAVNTDLGDFSGQANLTSLLAALGIPDVAGKNLYTCLITDRLDHGTYGLSAIETLVDDLEGRLTALRAGYLDNLSAGAVALQSSVDDLEGRLTAARAGYLDYIAHHEVTKAFFSPSQEEVSVPAGAATQTLPTVTLPNITGTITHMYVGFKFRMIENTNAGANNLNGAQNIQIQRVAEGWTTCISFVDNQFGLAASTREGGDCIIGTVDVASAKSAVFNDTYEIQWTSANADLSSLNFNDVQTFLIVSYY